MTQLTHLSVASRDEGRIGDVQRLSEQGAAGAASLVELLSDPSWVVRRAVVAALVRVGSPAIPYLCDLVGSKRGDESALAAAVEALVALAGDVEGAVLRLAAETTNPAVVCDAAQVLGRRKSRAAVPTLSAWATHPDDNVAVAAIEALGRIGGPDSVDALLAAVASDNFFRTFPAIGLLAQSGSARAIEPLAALLDSPRYRTEAAIALGRTSQIAAVVPLTRALRTGDAAMTRTVVRALIDLHGRVSAGAESNSDVPRAFRAAALAERVEPAEIVVPAEGEGEPAERLAVATVLAWVGDPRGMRGLFSLLESDAEVAKAALRGLGSVRAELDAHLGAELARGNSARRALLLPLAAGRRSATAEMALCLVDPDPGVRALAAEAIGRTGDESVVPAVFALLPDPDARVAQAALAAVQALGGAEARRLAVAAATSDDQRTRRAAIRVLSYFGYPEGLPILLEAADDEDPRVRDAAIAGLALSDDPRACAAVITSAARRASAGRVAAMRALGGMSSVREIVDVLLQGLSDDDAWVRYYACQSLGRLHVTSAADALVAHLADPAGQVRVAAVDALARLGGDRALASLGEAADSPDDDLRRAAILGLGAIRRPGVVPHLLRALASADAATRLVALSALAEDSSPETTAALIRAQSDDDARVRDAAFHLLAHRGGPQVTAWLVEQLSYDESRERALAAIADSADDRVQDLLGALEMADAETSRWVLRALLASPKPVARAAAPLALQLGNVHARRAAAEALAGLGTSDARAALHQASEGDPDPEVRRLSRGCG